MPVITTQAEKLASIVGKVTIDIIDGIIFFHNGGMRTAEIAKGVDLGYTVVAQVIAGDHWLQKEGKAQCISAL